jgi:HK97 gp10 family phage protein
VAIAKIEGLRELDRALAELPKATAKNVLRRTLNKAAKPVDDEASANAPHDTGKLEKSVIVGTQLTRSQRSSAFRPSSGSGYVEVHIGTGLGRGIFTEFGTFKDPAQMWFTRSWESTQDRALEIIKTDLGSEIEKAANRLRKKGKL